MRYLVFVDNREFEQGSLESHMAYLRNFGGTPDHWGGYNFLAEAEKAARDRSEVNNCGSIVYDDDEGKIVSRYYPDIENEINKLESRLTSIETAKKFEKIEEGVGGISHTEQYWILCEKESEINNQLDNLHFFYN